MSSFEEIAQGIANSELDDGFAAVIADARSINKFYQDRGTPVDFDEIFGDLAKLNEKWTHLVHEETVRVSGEIILNDDPSVLGDIFHCSDESIIELNDYPLRKGKFVLHDTLKLDGLSVVSGMQEIKFAGLVDIADLIGDDTESVFDEDEDDDQEPDSQNQGKVWGLVSIDQIAPRLATSDYESKVVQGFLEESCREHFVRICTALESTHDTAKRLAALSNLADVPEYREDAIAIYRDVLEDYLNDKIPFEENIPYILQTNGQYVRHTLEEDSGEYVVSDEAKPANIAAINLKLVVAYDEVGLPAISLRAYDLFGKDTISSRLNISLRSLIDIESTKSMLQAKLDETNE